MIGVLTRPLAGRPAGAVVPVVATTQGHYLIQLAGGERIVSHSDVERLRPSTGWEARGKCARRDPTDYDVSHGTGPVGAAKKARAASLCYGCPVLLDCALDALRDLPHDVVRAGVPFVGQQSAREFARTELAKQLHLPEPPRAVDADGADVGSYELQLEKLIAADAPIQSADLGPDLRTAQAVIRQAKRDGRIKRIGRPRNGVGRKHALYRAVVPA